MSGIGSIGRSHSNWQNFLCIGKRLCVQSLVVVRSQTLENDARLRYVVSPRNTNTTFTLCR
jgi:hypothetical protein